MLRKGNITSSIPVTKCSLSKTVVFSFCLVKSSLPLCFMHCFSSVNNFTKSVCHSVALRISQREKQTHATNLFSFSELLIRHYDFPTVPKLQFSARQQEMVLSCQIKQCLFFTVQAERYNIFMAFLQFYHTIAPHPQNWVPNLICLCLLTDDNWWFFTIYLLEYTVCSAALWFSNQPLNCHKQSIKKLYQPARKLLREEIIATYTLSKMLHQVYWALTQHLLEYADKKKPKQVNIFMTKSWSKH